MYRRQPQCMLAFHHRIHIPNADGARYGRLHMRTQRQEAHIHFIQLRLLYSSDIDVVAEIEPSA